MAQLLRSGMGIPCLTLRARARSLALICGPESRCRDPQPSPGSQAELAAKSRHSLPPGPLTVLCSGPPARTPSPGSPGANDSHILHWALGSCRPHEEQQGQKQSRAGLDPLPQATVCKAFYWSEEGTGREDCSCVGSVCPPLCCAHLVGPPARPLGERVFQGPSSPRLSDLTGTGHLAR